MVDGSGGRGPGGGGGRAMVATLAMSLFCTARALPGIRHHMAAGIIWHHMTEEEWWDKQGVTEKVGKRRVDMRGLEHMNQRE